MRPGTVILEPGIIGVRPNFTRKRHGWLEGKSKDAAIYLIISLAVDIFVLSRYKNLRALVVVISAIHLSTPL